MQTNCNILIFSAHPDDAELSIGGLIAKQVAIGSKVVIIDLTQGELGSRGSIEIRKQEAADAAKILGIEARENLKLEDGFFADNQATHLKIIQAIRKYKPTIVLANAESDRHPDHGRAAELIEKSCFLSGLRKIETSLYNKPQDVWRPKHIFHYVQDYYLKPDLIIDVTDYWETKMKSIRAYKSQFFINATQKTNEPQTPISTPEFIDFLEARGREYGRLIQAKFGEGLTSRKPIALTNLNVFI